MSAGSPLNISFSFNQSSVVLCQISAQVPLPHGIVSFLSIPGFSLAGCTIMFILPSTNVYFFTFVCTAPPLALQEVKAFSGIKLKRKRSNCQELNVMFPHKEEGQWEEG